MPRGVSSERRPLRLRGADGCRFELPHGQLLVIVGDPNALWEDASWRELLQYAVDHNSYRGCAQPLSVDGADDESLDALAGLIKQAAQRTLLGAGASSVLFPGLLGGAASIWGGDGLDDIDEEQGWKVAF